MRGTWVLVVVAACGFHPAGALATGDDGGTSGDGSNVVGMDAQDDAPTQPMPSGLIAWYTMDALGVTTAHDDSGNGHDATCTLCPTLVAGKINNGFHFDGTQRFDVADNANAFDTTAGFTVATWVRFETLTYLGNGFACPAGKVEDAANHNTWELCFDNSSSGSWLYDTTKVDANGTASFDELHELPAPTAGVWYHTAMSWDGNVKTLWLNGLSVVSAPNVSVAFEHGGAVTFGADTDNGGQQSSPFVGIMDDLRIYDHALGATEIAALAAH